MPIKQDDAVNYGKRICEYANAVLGLDILDEINAVQTVNIKTTDQLIQYHNQKEKPKLVELIHDVIQAEKSKIKPGEPFDVIIGTTIYRVIANFDSDGNTNLQITRELTQSEDSERFEMEKVVFPPITIKPDSAGKLKFDVLVNGHVVFNESSPRPKELQRSVIVKFGKKVVEGNPQQLGVMGTGTGKSWVIAGITHATQTGIIIVPDMDLANEMKKDAIGILHGKDIAEQIHFSTEYPSVDAFQKALKTVRQMIVVASDPLFHEKAASIQEQVVLMDESHQHTFSEEGIATLEKLRNNNVVLALTGTPTSRLKQIMGDFMVDINVRSVMDKGGLRQNYPMEDKVANSQIEDSLVNGYFARDEYLTRGYGVMTIDDIKANIAKGMSEDAAIDLAIKTNKERVLNQKNFFFCGTPSFRKQLMERYEKVKANPDADGVGFKIRQQRVNAEVRARANILLQLHPEKYASLEKAEEVVKPKVKPIVRLDLKAEINAAQKQQIAQSVNANALSLLFPKVKPSMFEKMQRTGQLAEFLEQNRGEMNRKLDMSRLEAIASGLPNGQREAYQNVVLNTAKRLMDDLKIANLCHEKDINLDQMGAKYTAHAYIGMGKDRLVKELIGMGKTKLADKFTDMGKLVKEFKVPPKESLSEKESKELYLSEQEWRNLISRLGLGRDEEIPVNNWGLLIEKFEKIEASMSAAALDQLRTGLVMHVASDSKFATGISIPSVMSVQQAIPNKNDTLKDSVNAVQLHGRNIRDNDRGAFNQQVVNENIPDEAYVHLKDIFDKHSGERLNTFFNYEQRREQETADFKKTRGAWETASSSPLGLGIISKLLSNVKETKKEDKEEKSEVSSETDSQYISDSFLTSGSKSASQTDLEQAMQSESFMSTDSNASSKNELASPQKQAQEPKKEDKEEKSEVSSETNSQYISDSFLTSGSKSASQTDLEQAMQSESFMSTDSNASSKNELASPQKQTQEPKTVKQEASSKDRLPKKHSETKKESAWKTAAKKEHAERSRKTEIGTLKEMGIFAEPKKRKHETTEPIHQPKYPHR